MPCFSRPRKSTRRRDRGSPAGQPRSAGEWSAVTDLDSDTWVSEVKRIRGKKLPLTSAGVHALWDEYTRTIEPARALAAETLTLERTLSDLVNQAYALTDREPLLAEPG